MAPEAVDEYVNYYYLGNNQALLMVQHCYADAVFEVRILNIYIIGWINFLWNVLIIKLRGGFFV